MQTRGKRSGSLAISVRFTPGAGQRASLVGEGGSGHHRGTMDRISKSASSATGLQPRRPGTSPEDAVQYALRWWGIEGSCAELPGDRDRNYLMEAAGGPRYVMKVALAGEGEAALDAQNAALDHVARVAPDLPAPRCVASLEGRSMERTTDALNRPLLVRLLTWVSGTPLPQGARPASALGDWGALAGRLGLALRSFQHPGAIRLTPWDLLGAVDQVEGRLDLIPERPRRSLLEEVVGEFRDLWQPVACDLRRQVVHNDLNDHNVIISDGGDGSRESAVGVIDFGDLIESVAISELAVAVAYGMLGTPVPIRHLTRMVEGYRTVQDLDGLEMEVLFPLSRLRLALSVSMSAEQSRAEPDNAYLRVSRDDAWLALEQFSCMDDVRILDRVRSSAGRRLHGFSSRTARWDTQGLQEARKQRLGTGMSLATSPGLEIVRGRGQYLYDVTGRAYLDLVNNVAHVGHAHPHVVAAEASQAWRLNTNSRYLHRLRGEYVERLTATLPKSLQVCWLVCSGTEANELALRLARTATGRRDVVVLDSAYHGNSSSMIDMSPYKHLGPGGNGPPEWVRTAPTPDPFRGPHPAGPGCAEAYVGDVRRRLKQTDSKDAPAAFFAEALPGCGGQVVPPDGFLRAAFDATREAGALAVADEVQTGFGRVGTHFWAFQTQDAHPDVVTLGKPIGNGHPLGAVVTTREIADAFENGMEYFNTFGGNPVSCAVGLAVLEVIEEEALQENARTTGEALFRGLDELRSTHAVIGEVRGLGLFLGVDLVEDTTSNPDERRPNADLAQRVIHAFFREGILISRDGPHGNVLKIKPPLCFDLDDAKRVVETLDRVLADDGV